MVFTGENPKGNKNGLLRDGTSILLNSQNVFLIVFKIWKMGGDLGFFILLGFYFCGVEAGKETKNYLIC